MDSLSSMAMRSTPGVWVCSTEAVATLPEGVQAKFVSLAQPLHASALETIAARRQQKDTAASASAEGEGEGENKGASTSNNNVGVVGSVVTLSCLVPPESVSKHGAYAVDTRSGEVEKLLYCADEEELERAGATVTTKDGTNKKDGKTKKDGKKKASGRQKEGQQT